MLNLEELRLICMWNLNHVASKCTLLHFYGDLSFHRSCYSFFVPTILLDTWSNKTISWETYIHLPGMPFVFWSNNDIIMLGIMQSSWSYKGPQPAEWALPDIFWSTAETSASFFHCWSGDSLWNSFCNHFSFLFDICYTTREKTTSMPFFWDTGGKNLDHNPWPITSN